MNYRWGPYNNLFYGNARLAGTRLPIKSLSRPFIQYGTLGRGKLALKSHSGKISMKGCIFLLLLLLLITMMMTMMMMKMMMTMMMMTMMMMTMTYR